MKNFVKLFGLVFAAFVVLSSCEGLIKTGGTIEVTNNYQSSALIAVAMGVPSLDDAEAIDKGATKTFTFKEDGLYTIIAAPVGSTGAPVTKTATLLGGNKEKVSIGP